VEPSIRDFADKRRSLGRYSSLEDSGHGDFSLPHECIGIYTYLIKISDRVPKSFILRHSKSAYMEPNVLTVSAKTAIKKQYQTKVYLFTTAFKSERSYGLKVMLCYNNTLTDILYNSYTYTRVVRKIRFPRSCSREERCYAGSGDTGM
jgi:hypothetical protein